MSRPICRPDMTNAERIKFKSEVSDTGCWVWQACIGSNGYGSIGLAGKNYKAHRVSYEAFVGPIPEGLDLDHLCRNRACVNPEHLEPVTRGENIRRGDHRERRKTHCSNGHPFAGENLYFENGVRRCRECSRVRARASRKGRA